MLLHPTSAPSEPPGASPRPEQVLKLLREARKHPRRKSVLLCKGTNFSRRGTRVTEASGNAADVSPERPATSSARPGAA